MCCFDEVKITKCWEAYNKPTTTLLNQGRQEVRNKECQQNVSLSGRWKVIERERVVERVSAYNLSHICW